MKFTEKSIRVCCDFPKCAGGFHTMFYLSETVQICKKTAIYSNLVIEKKKNDFIVTNANDYLIKQRRFVK